MMSLIIYWRLINVEVEEKNYRRFKSVFIIINY